MAICPFAEWHPTDKYGYPDIPNDANTVENGIVMHSLEGSVEAGLQLLSDPEILESWHFTIALDGRVLQHVDTSEIAWHAGSYRWNKTTLGVEAEGEEGQMLTPQQKQATTRLAAWIFRQHHLGQPQRRVNLWEHRELALVDAIFKDFEGGEDLNGTPYKWPPRVTWPEHDTFDNALKHMVDEMGDSPPEAGRPVIVLPQNPFESD